MKTGTDPQASSINLAAITDTTVSALDAVPAPSYLPQDSRVNEVETNVYQVHATLVGFKMESDSDYHLILQDGSASMIAEIPDPACVGTASPLLPGIERARSEFDARYHPSSGGFTHVSAPVVVTGVGFFDFLHGQDGVAPNGIEIHPVQSIQFQG